MTRPSQTPPPAVPPTPWRLIGSALLPVVAAPPYAARDQAWLDALKDMPTVFHGTTFAKATGISVHDATHALARLAKPGHVFALGGRSGVHINLVRSPEAGWDEVQVAIQMASPGSLSCGCHTLYNVSQLAPGEEAKGIKAQGFDTAHSVGTLRALETTHKDLLMQALATLSRRLLGGPGRAPCLLRGFQAGSRPHAWLDRVRQSDGLLPPSATAPVLVAASTLSGTAIKTMALPHATPGVSLADLYLYGESSDLPALAQALSNLGVHVELPYQASTGDRVQVQGVLAHKEGRRAPGPVAEAPLAARQPAIALVKPRAFAAALSSLLSDNDRITFESCVAYGETIATPRYAPRYRAA